MQKKLSLLFLLLTFTLIFSGCDTAFFQSEYSISGRVEKTLEDESGESTETIALSGITVRAGTETATTGEDGTFVFDNLTGRNEVWVEDERWQFDGPVVVTGGRTDLVFTAYEQIYQVSGKVVDDTGEGLPGVEIDFRAQGGENDESFGTVITGEDGEFTRAGLRGEVNVVPEKSGYDFSPESLNIDSNSDDVYFSANLVKYSASGWILMDLDDTDSGIPGATIEFSSQDTEEEFTPVNTGSDGYWKKTGLKGEVVVTPKLEELEDDEGGWYFSPANKTIDRETAGEEINFEGTPSDVHKIYEASGLIIDNEGEEVDAALLEFERNGEVIGTAITDDGEWTKERLWGTITVRPRGIPPEYNEEYAPLSYEISSPEGNVDFVQYDDKFDISGRIMDENEEEIPAVTIELDRKNPITGEWEDMISIVSEDGEWARTDVYGEVRITPEKDGWEFEPQERTTEEHDNQLDFVGEEQ